MTNHPLVEAIVSALDDVVPATDLQIAGDWTSSTRLAYKDDSQHGSGEGPFVEAVDRRWRGSISCAKPVVAIGFLITARELWWIKSPPREDTLWINVSLSSWRADTRGGAATFNCSLAGAYLPGVPVPFDGKVDSFPLGPQRSTTGKALVVAHPEGADFVIVTLPVEAIKVGRKRLWHLRAELADRMPEKLRTILTRGRTGNSKST